MPPRTTRPAEGTSKSEDVRTEPPFANDVKIVKYGAGIAGGVRYPVSAISVD
jgi:hypothetical protein